MRYYDLIGRIEGKKIGEIHKILLGGKKNEILATLRDYYNGNQWMDAQGKMTDTTRSGKQVWNIAKKSPQDLGVGPGELQVFNVCDTTVNIYSSYARGDINAHNRIRIEDNDNLAQELNDNLNLDTIIPRTVTRGTVDSFTGWKYTVSGEDGKKATIEFVDGLELFPIYLGHKKVGTIRIYEISPNDPMVVANDITIKDKKKAVMYMEIWYPNEKGIMWLKKFINEEQIEDGVAPYEFDPHIYVPNKDNEFMEMDESHTEVSDVGRLLDVQDALNKTITEEGIIISKVAFPLVKVIKEIYEKMSDGTIDPDLLKKQLSEVSLVAGKIISAPIEREPGQDIPSGVDKYIDIIFEQIYRLTGIPKSVFVSEGIGNISEKTISAMMESLRRRIDEKRTNIEEGIKKFVVMYTGDPNIKDAVSIEWAEMFAMSKEEMANLVLESFFKKALPIEYVAEKLLEIFGDGERVDEIIKSMKAEDFSQRLTIESEKLKSANERERAGLNKQLERERKARTQAETDKTLLESEITKMISE